MMIIIMRQWVVRLDLKSKMRGFSSIRILIENYLSMFKFEFIFF